MTESETPLPMLTKVRIKHFRSIEDTEFTLEPLTVLVGPNASGKSNVLDALGFLGDMARDGLESAVQRRGGIDAIGWRSPTGRVHGPEFSYDLALTNARLGDARATYNFALKRLAKGEYIVAKERVSAEGVQGNIENSLVEFKNGKLAQSTISDIIEWIIQGYRDKTPQRMAKELIPLDLANSRISHLPDKSLRLLPQQSLSAVPELIILLQRVAAAKPSPILSLIDAIADVQIEAGNIAFYHLFPNTLRQPQKMTDSSPLLPDAGNLTSALHDMLHREDSFAEEIKDCLAVAVPGVQDIRVSTAGSHQVIELKHVPPLSGRYLGDREMGAKQKGSWFDLVHEADGTIRMLALLTALYQQPSPSMICLEEPEVGIHPGALAVIRDVLLEAPLRSQVVVTTHSPELIGMLPVESIRAVSAESGSTKVGPIAGHQLRSVKKKLFNAGEIHNIEGLHPELAIGEPVC